MSGYVLCRVCSTPVVDEIALRTGGLCPPDSIERHAGRSRVIEVSHLGRRQPAPVPLSRKSRKRNKPKVRDKRAEKAKLRALKRLRALFPDLYDILLAEERAREGLEPWTIERAAAGSGTATFDFAEVYDALVEQGVDLDGLEAQPTHQ